LPCFQVADRRVRVFLPHLGIDGLPFAGSIRGGGLGCCLWEM